MVEYELTEERSNLLRELERTSQITFRKAKASLYKNPMQELSPSQAFILEHIAIYGPKRISDLAEKLEITLPSVTGLSDRLISLGYVTRRRSEKDRRIVLLDITKDGQKALQGFQRRRQQILSFFCDHLSTDDLQHLIRIYNKVLPYI
ncbi:MarR family winged helix-turn-helix transcriptional regulator [Aneurinibacillus aneurinilyticus]|jgi:DNA-binding MarR family transcriptional regulator|uniref:Transcriptional regulator, MarR family n=1 Tax=Aneurinibacillus aneurinilyticus ATCC 12856 TaxID=649747 RepID=U1WZF4_ANEAE|nr:MarR family transcriptional regulator [Aneurinibacillus aneurinilyticus]ERI07648.1 transcriptional regulator, MarR family [Aneurinibacillus aneurinilyticus ATCC 12856]MCI1692745.1 MarR family transcriptional regulator [Aneurinibacillus aneurinilyticus]MED0668749.1 MarR family transcriptional regulator [Aneurinibacillus aneurinilyticus]MED0707203.1 MarR family transcriptional regulator [Aneurinibacillus aneurinilyticus]MED0722060.1 MarR family transcriptional regulator [Aneurinibacillus aneu